MSGVTREAVHVLAWRLLDYDGREPTWGGLQRWLLELAALLGECGHPVVVHQRANAPFTRELRPGLVVRGHRASPRATATPRFNVRAHREVPPGAPVVYMAEDLAWPICRARSVVVQHGIWWDGEYGWWKTRLAERLARHAVLHAGATVCVDTNFVNWFRARWPESGCDERFCFVPNFVDAAQWGPQPAPDAIAARVVPGGRLTICFPRRSEPRRGVYLMADVTPRLAQRFPHVDFRFVVGSGYHTDRLCERLRTSGLDASRWRVESLPFDRMREAYATSAIAVIPTVCGEGTSLSAIEAMYCGCAVVGTWVGGLANLLRDEENALVVAPVATQLEAALSRLIVDAPLRERLGHAGVATAARLGLEQWRRRLTPILRRALQLPDLHQHAAAPTVLLPSPRRQDTEVVHA